MNIIKNIMWISAAIVVTTFTVFIVISAILFIVDEIRERIKEKKDGK